MIRGQQAITAHFPAAVGQDAKNKGRRNLHIDRRDDDLTIRFYYWFHLQRKRYDDCLIELEKEFYITTLVISQRLSAKGDILKQLVKDEAKAADLKKRLPQYTWG